MAAPLPNFPCAAFVARPGEILITGSLIDCKQGNPLVTTLAKLKDKRLGISEHVNIGTWNVRGIANKEYELLREVRSAKLDLVMLSETKKKQRGTCDLGNYTLIYSGVPIENRAVAGTAILINEKWRNRITSYSWINERIVTCRFKIARGYMSIISVYAPEEGRKEESDKFYESLQSVLDSTNKNDYIVIGGDMNARIGQQPIKEIIGTNGEVVINQNGKVLRDFVNFNSLRIENTFFRHKDIHKFTWVNRGYRSIIDYLIANEKMGKLFQDVRVMRGMDINSDHFLVRGKVILKTKWARTTRKKITIKETVWKTNLLEDPSIRNLFQSRIRLYMLKEPISTNIELEWQKLTQLIESVAFETLGKRNKYKPKKGLNVWNEELKRAVQRKKESYLQWLMTKTPETLEEYKIQRRETKKIVKAAHKESWERYISNIERDVHCRQYTAYKIMKHLNREEKDAANLDLLDREEWIKFCKHLWTKEEGEDVNDEEEENNRCISEIDKIEFNELQEALQSCKNRKAPGSDNLNIELFKYLPEEAKNRLQDFLNQCWQQKRIPMEWKKAVVIPIFKGGPRTDCENYRGISLLNTAYKIYGKIIANRLRNIVDSILLEEQTGFRKGRSCSDNIFILKQIIEKRREYNLKTYIVFIDYSKAFDSVHRGKLWKIMEKRGIPLHLIEVIRNIYLGTQINIKLKSGIIAQGNINKGVRQGCCISPILFNLYLDNAVREWKQQIMKLNIEDNFKGTNFIKTFMFADDQILVADKEDNLQRALYELYKITKQYNLSISTNKTKSMAFQGSQPLRCKFILENKIIEQVNTFRFLGCDVSYLGEVDIVRKIERFNMMCGTIKRALKGKVRKDTMLKFYKVMAVPCGLYGSENWTMNSRTHSRLQAAEMRFLRSVLGVTRMDRLKNETIRKNIGIYNLNEKIKEYREQWKKHLERMEDDRIPKQVLQYIPKGRRSVGRPRRRWLDQGGATDQPV